MSQLFTPKFVDMVRVTSLSQGTGPLVCGPALPGFASFADSLSVGDTFYYSVQGVDKPQEREVGRGTLLANGTIGRQPLAGSATAFTAGAKTIALVAAAEWYADVQQACRSTGRSEGVSSRAALKAMAAESGSAVFLSEKGREGTFLWDAAVTVATHQSDPAEGVFVAPSNTAPGAWVRRFDGAANVRWFGARGDNLTNDGPAFAAAIAFLSANATAINGWGSVGLYIPQSKSKYYLGTTTLDITAGIEIFGDSTRFSAASYLRWDDATGFRVQRHNTSGAMAFDTVPHSSGSGATIRNLTLEGTGSFTGANADFHAIHLRGQATVRDCFIHNWKGNGIHVFAVAGANGAGEGNANLFRVRDVRAQCCQNGLYVDGPDANAGTIDGFDATANRRWGIWDSSFLGNIYTGCHSDANTLFDGGKAVASHNGQLYAVAHGQEAGASTNPPTGASTSNQWWFWIGAGVAVAGYGRRQWASGMTWLSGGAYLTDDVNAANVFSGCYSESGQPPAQFEYPTEVIGGLSAAGALRLGHGTTFGAQLGAGAGVDGWYLPRDLRIGRDISIDGTVKAHGAVQADSVTIAGSLAVGGFSNFYGASHNFGTTSGAPSDTAVNYHTNNAFITVGYNHSGTKVGEITSVAGSGLVLSGLPNLMLYGGGGPVATVRVPGIDLGTGKSLLVNGVQVVAARRGGWTAATGAGSRGAFAAASAGTASASYTPGELQAALNRLAAIEARFVALESDLRAHGLIN